MPRGCVINGNIRVYSDGPVALNGVLFAFKGSHDQQPAEVPKAHILLCCRSASLGSVTEGSSLTNNGDDDFMVEVRRGSMHPNFYI